MAHMIYLLFPGARYNPSGSIQPKVFADSRLFGTALSSGNSVSSTCYGRLDIPVGNDMMTVVDAGVTSANSKDFSAFNFLEVPYQYFIRPIFGVRIESTMHSFRGMFGCCKLNRTFRGYVMLLPDHLENKIGYLAQTIQGMKEKYGAKFVHLEDPEFERHFAVYADDEVEARMVLTPAMMRKLTAPLQKITDAAQRFGGGDFSVRVEGVEGEGEVVDLAHTFNQMAENIQSNDNSRGQFMGNIAHELRTPMTTIKGFVDGILDGTIPPEMQNHYLQLVSEETGRLARLIQNMLDLSKLESGEYQVNARMFNIWETLTGVALAAEQRINDGMIELEGLTMDEKVLVYADPDLIHQVAYNLLDNAIKFTPAGGTIRFSVEKLGPEAEISIWNSGQGISPEALPYVFQRFYKEDQSRGLHARGAGLGLNICKVLVNLAGGQIRVESQQGEWCRFVFTLPTCSPNPGGMKRLPDAAGQPGAVEDPASMKPVE